MNTLPYRKGVSALVISERKFLLIQKPGYGEGQWDLPGGGVDEKETLEKAMLRELKEELGTTEFEILGKSDVVDRYDWPEETKKHAYEKSGKWWQGTEKHQFLVKYPGDKKDINLQKEEIKQLKWVSQDQLEKHLVFEGQWKTVNEALEDLKAKGLL